MSVTVIGKHVLVDVSLFVNGVDLSDHVSQVTFMEFGTNKQAAAGMQQIQDFDMPGTLVVSAPAVTFFNDFNTAQVYATLNAAWLARTVFNIVGKPSSGARALTNPEWTIPVFVGKAPVMNGKRGDAHMAAVTFEVAGTASVLTS